MVKQQLTLFKEHLSSRVNFLESYYEDLYLSPREKGRKALDEILDLIGCDVRDKMESNFIKYIFNPLRKQNHPGILKQIPNYAEVKKFTHE